MYILGVFCIESSVLATTYFGPEGLSSAVRHLTSLFGMGRGGSTALNHQNRGLNLLFFVGKYVITDISKFEISYHDVSSRTPLV